MMSIENALNMFGIKVEEVEPEEVLSREDLEMTKKILDNIDAIDNNLKAAIEAAKEMEPIEVEVLLDPVSFDSKPQTTSIVGIVSRLPQNRVNINLEDLANAAINGQSWKASVLYGKDNASFVSSSIVALDIDNDIDEKAKEKGKVYTSIDEFLAMDHKYQPCFVYETFSNTKEHNRFRVVYVFNDTVYDFNTMAALYNEVKAQYPTVDIDNSVDPGKILFGGKVLRYFNNVSNSLPELTGDVLESVKVSMPGQTSNAVTGTVEVSEITEAEVLINLSMIADKYAHIKSLDLNESDEWITKNVGIEDVLAIPQNVRFRCVLPDHEDNHPSARITTIDGEQVYFCTCEASGYRIIPLLSKLLKKSIYSVKTFILKALGIECGTEYQRNAEKQIVDMKRHLVKRLGPELKDYLSRRSIFQVYNSIMDFALSHIPYNSFANDDKIVFFMGQRVIRKYMKDHHVKNIGDVSRKITALCELGLLRKLTDSELKDYVLRNANQSKNELKQKLSYNTGTEIVDINRVDFYELVDLSPAVVKRALSIIDNMKKNAVRQRGNNIGRRVNTFGAETVLNSIHVQSTVNKTKLNKTQSKLEAVIVDLLGSNKYFSEADLATAYRNTDKHNISKAKAQQTVLDYVPVFLATKLIKRVRVNKDTRKQYNIAAKYLSNSFVYVAK